MDEALRHEREQLQEQAQGLKDELRKVRDDLENLKPMMTSGARPSSCCSTRCTARR